MTYRMPAQNAAPTIEPIPGSIVKALAAIQATVDAVRKSQKNQHGGYMYASVDDIYAAISRKMGEVGLTVLSLEDECGVERIERDGKTVQWLRAVYSFVLATEEATWTDPRFRRTIFVQVTGAQTFQAAQSYCEKQFLRSLFKLPTGDMDLDSMPQGDTLEDQMDLLQPRKRKSSSGAKKDGTDHLFNEIMRHLQGAANAEDLQFIRGQYATEWAEMPARWHALLEDEYATKLESFGVHADG